MKNEPSFTKLFASCLSFNFCIFNKSSISPNFFLCNQNFYNLRIPIIRSESRLLRQIKFSFIMILDCILDRRERARKENLMVLRGQEELWLLEGWEHRSPLFYSLPLFPAAQIPLSFCIVLLLRIHQTPYVYFNWIH